MCYKQTDEAGTDTIERLVAIANRGDRFNLENDPTVQEANLDNDIHPIFHHSQFLERTPHLKHAIQLASLYICTRSLLDFYLHLTFGVFESLRSNTQHSIKNYYGTGDLSRDEALDIVEASMKCLSHSVTWQWDALGPKIWGKTQHYGNVPTQHTDECPVYDDEEEQPFFWANTGCTITLNRDLLDFYLDEQKGYITRSRCDQFRHDFQLAMVLSHEIAHAFGAMSHGNLHEPWLGTDHPDNEQGYAWENYMFGSLINPVSKLVKGEYIHMHKAWHGRDAVVDYSGLEWNPVPVAWIAQWFRRETWDIIAVRGHRTINLPEPAFKIYGAYFEIRDYRPLRRFVVYTNDEAAREDVELCRQSAGWRLGCLPAGDDNELSIREVSEAMWMPMSQLSKKPLMPTPQRLFDEPLTSGARYLCDAEARVRACMLALGELRSQLTLQPLISIAGGKVRKPIGHHPKPERPTQELLFTPRSMNEMHSDRVPKREYGHVPWSQTAMPITNAAYKRHPR